MLDIKDTLKHSFLLARGYDTVNGFYISVPSLNGSDFDFQIISKEQMINAITRGEETFYCLGDDNFLDLETAFEKELDNFIDEFDFQNLEEDELEFEIEKYVENQSKK